MATPGGLVDKTELINAQLDTAHLGRVVNSKDASGNPIDTSTNRTGGVNKTLDALETEYLEAIQGAGGVSVGVWTAGVTTFNAYNEYAVYNGIPYKPRTSAMLPYVAQGADPTIAPDDANVQPYQEITEAQVVAVVEETIPTVLPGELPKYTDIVYKASEGDSAVENMIVGIPVSSGIGDVVSTGATAWKRVANSGDISDFIPLNGVWVEDFGAESGSSDSTQKIQDAIDSMRAGSCLKGYGEFTVTTILPKQATSIRSMRFKSLGTTDEVSHVPVIRIGDNVNEFDGLLIDKVHIDGNRINHQNINLFAGGDGGMHGIHIRAKTKNITIRDSSANYCGTAGLALDWDENRPPSTDAPSYEIADINIVRCDFNNNREHGSFAAYCQRVKYIDCNMTNNGNDLPGGPWTVNQGGHGAFTVANGYFGRGLDIESYNSVSGFTKISIKGGDYSGNANGSIQFFDPTTFPSNRIAAAHCIIDNVIAGPAVNSIDPSNNNTVNVQASPSSTEYGMNGLSITNITLQGKCRINGVSGLNISGTHIPVSGINRGLDIFNSRRISTSLSSPQKVLINDIEDASNNPTITTMEGSSTTSVLLERYTQPVGGVSRITYRIRVSGGGISGTANAHQLVFPDGLPENVSREPVVFQKDTTGSISGDISNYRPIAYTSDDNPADPSPDVFVNSTGTGDLYDLYVTVNVVAGREI